MGIRHSTEILLNDLVVINLTSTNMNLKMHTVEALKDSRERRKVVKTENLVSHFRTAMLKYL